ncbi:hypothetical protein B0H11DRAFT_2008826 [Mycena galericulata]|nr:hypothetical protein B0H11DRAFT_2008826 [Mycena galericulata]
MTTGTNDSAPPPGYNPQNTSETKKLEAAGSGSAPGARYVYYRVYSLNGAIPSKTALNPGNPFMGRITARSIPPPHTVTSLKRCLVKAENFTDPDGSRMVLYPSNDAPGALDSSQAVAIRGAEMPNGATPETAFALVLQEDLTENENAAINQMDLSSRCEADPKYLYYQLYTQTGEDTSRVSFNLNEPSLGRIERILVPPPHGPTSIKRHIAKVEGKPIYAYSDLYENISALQAMSDKHFSLMQNNSPGWTEDKPMVLVQPERRPGLLNRPFKVLSNAQLTHFAPSVGALGNTDGVPINKQGKVTYKCIMHVLVAGTKSGYLPADYIKFLDE